MNFLFVSSLRFRPLFLSVFTGIACLTIPSAALSQEGADLDAAFSREDAADTLPATVVESQPAPAVSAPAPVPRPPRSSTQSESAPVVIDDAVPRAASLTVPSAREAWDELARMPAAVSLIPEERLELGKVSTLKDAVDFTPGVIVGHRSGDEQRVSIRGSGLSLGYDVRGVFFLQDGIPLTGADGFTGLDSLDPLNAQYIAVHRGGSALRYGAANLGGAIHYVSHTGHTADPLTLRQEFGSFGFNRSFVSAGGVSGPLDFYTALSYLDEDGFRDNAAYEAWNFNANLGYRLGDSVENRLFLSFQRSDKALPGALSKDELFADPTQTVAARLPYLNREDIHYKFALADKITVLGDESQFEASVFWRTNDIFHPLGSGPFFRTIYDIRENEFGTRAVYTSGKDFLGARNEFTAGINAMYGRGRTKDYDNNFGRRGVQTGDAITSAWLVDFFFEEKHYLGDSLALVLGSSLVHTTREVEDILQAWGNSSYTKDYFGFSPKVALQYEFAPETTAWLSWSRSFEPPTFDEIRNWNTFSILDAQEADTIEFGTRGRAGRLDWDFALYHSWVENEFMPLVDPASGLPLGTLNAGDTRHFGIEIGTKIALLGGESADAVSGGKGGKHTAAGQTGNKLDLLLTYNWNHFHFADDPVYGNNQIGAVPAHYLRAELLYQHPGGFYAGPNLECVMSDYPVDLANTLDVDAWAVLNFRVGHRSKKGVNVFFEARNLTDETYASTVGLLGNAGGSTSAVRPFYPADGRGFYGGIEWKF